MTGIHITQFAGITPELNAKLLDKTVAQIAHNCLLWDGSLRPMPQWQLFQVMGLVTDYGVIFEDSKTNNIFEANEFTKGVYLNGRPFADKIVVGLDIAESVTHDYYSNIRFADKLNMVATSLPSGLPTPTFFNKVVNGQNVAPFISAWSVTYTPQLHSTKATNRVIGVTFCRKTINGFEESPIAVIPGQDPSAIIYEGDVAHISLTIDTITPPEWGITHIRLYRSVSGIDSGEKVGNELDTDWHLIDTVPYVANVVYNDGGAATSYPLDMYLAEHFYCPQFLVNHFGVTEGGWFYGASVDGRLMVSERYLHTAWPTENVYAIPEYVTDAVAHYDNIFIGTRTYPYVMALGPGEGTQGLQASLTPFPQRAACLPGTMVKAVSGAVYASPVGLVAVSKDGQKVITAGILNAGDVLYSHDIGDGTKDEIRIELTTLAAYWQGKYFGFIGGRRDIPPNVYLTSRPYPINVIEALEASASLERGRLVHITEDALDIAASIVSGVLRNIIHEYHESAEALDVTASLRSGVLHIPIHTQTMAPEALDIVASLQSGELNLIVVETTMAAEALDIVASLQSGTLV